MLPFATATLPLLLILMSPLNVKLNCRRKLLYRIKKKCLARIKKKCLVRQFQFNQRGEDVLEKISTGLDSNTAPLSPRSRLTLYVLDPRERLPRLLRRKSSR